MLWFVFVPYLSASSGWCLLCVFYREVCFLHIRLSLPGYHAYISFDILLQTLYFFLSTAFGTLCILEYSALIYPLHIFYSSSEGHRADSYSYQILQSFF